MSVFHDKYQEKLAEGLATMTLQCISASLSLLAGILAYLYRNNPIALAVLATIAICSLILLLVIFAWSKRVQPADFCPYCRRRTGEFVEYLPARNLTAKWHGIETNLYKCSNPDCGKDYGKPIKPAT
jgi:hypothetical protein